MNIVIVTGLSGAGKSQAANAFEDIGYYCIDNMPPSLIPRFAEMSLQLNRDSDIAIITDVRTGDLFEGFFEALDELKKLEMNYKIMFLDASDEVLIKRYSESRRKHPLASADGSIADAIREERKRLAPVLEMADYRIDTTYLSAQQLKDSIITMFLADRNTAMKVRCLSFGYKYGIPAEADLVLDVRFLPNPFYVDELKSKTGLDKEVYDYVMDNDQTTELLEKFSALVDFLLPLYRTEGKSQLVLAIGCTGGKHRSVALAEYMSRHISETGFRCKAIHRDINKVL